MARQCIAALWRGDADGGPAIRAVKFAPPCADMEVIDLGLTCDNAFWQFSIRVYASSGVADDCLAVQEQYGIDVNALLFCAWIAQARKIELAPQDIEALDAVVASWHENVVRPLRSVRRYMKGLPDGEISALRTRVKGVEIDAEQIEQAMLFAHAEQRLAAEGHAPLAAAVRANLESYLRAHGYRRQNSGDWPLNRMIEAVTALSAQL
ncbi:MAG: TIGR02444 family protein [Pseudolabrys sp.]